MERLTAFFLTIYLFFAGLAYGNEPIKVDILESPFDNGPVVVQVAHHPGGVFTENGETVTYFGVSVNWIFQCKNTGRPIRGESNYNITLSLQSANPDTPPLRVYMISPDMVEHDVLIRHDQTFRTYAFFMIPDDAPAGVWNVVVSVFGSPETVYENALVIL